MNDRSIRTTQSGRTRMLAKSHRRRREAPEPRPQLPKGLSDGELSRIVSESWTLQERMTKIASARTVPPSGTAVSDRENGAVAGPKHVPDRDALAQEWQQALGGSESDDRLSRRLQWSGWTFDDFEAALTPRTVSDVAHSPLPNWSLALQRYSAELADHFDAGNETQALSEEAARRDRHPFDGLLSPIVSSAVEDLRRQLKKSGYALEGRLSQTAVDQLAEWLLSKLAILSEDTFYQAFAATRPLLENLLLLHTGEADKSLTYERYAAFIAHHRQTGLREIFQSFPMLARLFGTTIENWLAACAELIERLENDWDELAAFAGFPREGTTVAGIECGLSDPHHNGRSVFILKFTGGAKAVYKPRDLTLERELRVIARRLCRQCPVDFPFPAVLSRPAYGWMEFIADERDGSTPTSEKFWRNAGALLGLLHILGGRDAHFENIFITKAGPVLIDAEVMFSVSHATDAERPTAKVAEHIRAMDNLVINTGFLPEWTKIDCGSVGFADASGLGSLFPDVKMGPWRSAVPRTEWLAVNSDQMRPKPASKSGPAGKKREKKAGKSHAPELPRDLGITDELIATMLDGFERVYRAAMAAPHQIKENVARSANARWRLIHRPTRVYHLLLRETRLPERLRSGLQFGLHLEKLMAIMVAQQQRPHAWPVFVNSIEQMSALDIPYYCCPVGARQLHADHQSSAPLISIWESGLESAQARLDALSPADLRVQREYIRAAFEARRASDNKRRRDPVRLEWSSKAQPKETESTLLGAAVAIADQIASRSVRHKGHLRWLAPSMATEAGHLTARFLDRGLYEGVSGVAIFLAALDNALGQRTYESIWMEALAPVRKRAGRTPPRFANLGLADGHASQIYALTVLRDLSDERHRDWIDASARSHIAALNDRVIAADTTHDVLGGAAGAILSLVGYYRSSGHEAALDKARKCAEHLIVSYPGLNLRDVPTGGQVLCGMSHGAAGVALSLGRLWAITGEERLMRAVSRLVDFEDRHYDHDTRNWRDLREGGGSDMRAWCHGAPGIALARGGLVEVGLHKVDDRILRDWDRAIQGSRVNTCPRVDHACCGLVGTIDALLHRGVAMGDQSLVAEGQGLALQMLNMAAANSTPRLWAWDHAPLFDPSFFRGLSGIGYAYLRALAPHRFPSILNLETTCADMRLPRAERGARSGHMSVDRRKEVSMN
jgi:class II lanthipeptide synthase